MSRQQDEAELWKTILEDLWILAHPRISDARKEETFAQLFARLREPPAQALIAQALQNGGPRPDETLTAERVTADLLIVLPHYGLELIAAKSPVRRLRRLIREVVAAL